MALSLLRQTNEKRLSSSSSSSSSSGGAETSSSVQFVETIDINDSPAKVVLTKGSTHNEILDDTGALVVPKGLYRPPTALEGIDYDANSPPPLYLHISAPTRAQLEAAVLRIRTLMTTPSSVSTPAEQKLDSVEQQIPFSFYQPTSAFNIVPEILGARGSYLKHIEDQTHVKVQLRARGQPDMHLHITAASQESLDKACSLARSLIGAVEKKFTQWHLNPPVPLGNPPLSLAAVPPPPVAPPPHFLLQLHLANLDQ